MNLPQRVEDLIGPTVEDLGYAVVRVQISGQQRLRLQVMVERLDGRPVVVDDCAELSRSISAVLDVEDPIDRAYVLEVSSPGIDRPLVRPDDYIRFAGFEAKVELGRPLDGRRRFRGRLLGLAGDAVRMRIDDAEVDLPYADIAKAKLVLTDDLLAAAEDVTKQ